MQTFAAAAGSAILLKSATGELGRLALAEDSGDDDSSGRGRGRGRGGDDHDKSGPGNGDDSSGGDRQVAITGAIPEGAIEVRIVNDDAGGFVPGELTVDPGQTVAFVNVHHDEHTATGSGFDTGIINPGQVATVVLDTPGSFAYACQIHPEMTGRIGVRGEDGVVPHTQSAAQAVPADASPVRIINLSFDPADVTIPTGATVVWTNDDSAPHTVTSADGIFDSRIFDPGASFSWTFAQPGTFAYACQLHPQMLGRVITQREAVASRTPAAEQPSAASADPTVLIANFAFEPATLDASTGATVVWTNNGQIPHTVTGDFADSGVLEPGQTFAHTFADAGEFGYACVIHPNMVGTVRIAAAAAIESAQSTPTSASVETPRGVWIFSLTPDDETVLSSQQALATFDDNGTIEVDFLRSPGAVGAASALAFGRGEWTVENGMCRLTLVAFASDANEQFAGTVLIDAQGQLDATARTIDGTFGFSVTGADGQTQSEGTGLIRGGAAPVAI